MAALPFSFFRNLYIRNRLLLGSHYLNLVSANSLILQSTSHRVESQEFTSFLFIYVNFFHSSSSYEGEKYILDMTNLENPPTVPNE